MRPQGIHTEELSISHQSLLLEGVMKPITNKIPPHGLVAQDYVPAKVPRICAECSGIRPWLPYTRNGM